jgi:DNA-binding transcriptional LysR family regulator
VVWFGAPTLDTLKKRPLPLVLFESPCVIRQMIINALDAARIPWEIAYTATTLESVSAAIKAKLGVTALPASAPLQPIKGWKTDGLPALPELECRLYSSSLNQPAPVSGLAEIITEELAELAEQAIQTSRRMLA